MLREPVFECPFPEDIHDMETLGYYLKPIVGEHFIATANKYGKYYLPEEDTRYLHLCNRFTRSWSFSKFPTLYSTVEEDYRARCEFKLLGFFRPTIIVVFIINPHVSGTPFSLELWQLSDDLESLYIVHTVLITRDRLPTRRVDFFSEGENMHVFFNGYTTGAADNTNLSPQRQCVAIECTTSSSQSIEKFVVDFHTEYSNVIMHNGTAYLVDLESETVVEYNNGQLIHLTDFPLNSPGIDADLLSLCSSNDGNLYALEVIDDRLHYYEYDFTTQLWCTRSTVFPFHDYSCFTMRDAPAGEVLFNIQRYVEWDAEMELVILSTVVPKLSVLALRCLQKNMPRETAEKMASEKYICDPISFVKFLFSSNNQHAE